MIFRSLFDLRAYLDRMIDMGIGHAKPVLDRRGCDCASGPVHLGDPGDGERVSADGSQVYISCRRMER